MLVILVQLSIGFINISTAAPDGFKLVSCSWGSVNNPQKVYPGSTNVVLIIEILNDYSYTLNSVVGNLSLPSGFTDINGYNYSVSVGTVQINSTTRYTVKPGEIFTLNYILNLNENLTPGTYKASLNLSYTYLNNSSGVLNSSSYVLNDIPLKVSDFPTYSFSIKQVMWYANNVVTNATIGSRGLSLHIMIENEANVSIDDLYAYLNLKKPFTPIQISDHYGGVNAKSRFELIFNNINVEYNASPGAYIEDLILNYTFRGYGNAVNDYATKLNITVYVYSSVYAGLELVKVSWQGFNKEYSGGRGGYINLVLENMGDYTITNLYFIGHLPNGFRNQFNTNVLNNTYSGNLGYGDFLQIALGPIYVNDSIAPGIYYMNVHLRGVGTINGVKVVVEENFNIPIIINEYSALFEVVSVEWSYNGGPALALPGSKDISLIIKLAYRGEEELSGLNPLIELPNGFKIKSISQYPQVVNPSSTFTISFNLDISSSVESKDYVSSLKIKYTVAPNEQNTIKTVSIPIPYHITSKDTFNTKIDILNAYWGRNSPEYVYPGSQNNPLTITLVNKGVYDAYQIYVNYSLPKGFSITPEASNVADLLRISSFVQSLSYVNVSNEVSPGYYEFNITVYYELHLYGAIISKSEDLYFNILISPPIYSPPYLKIISYGWEGGQDMYPGTDHAALQISIENDANFPVSAVHIYIESVKGISLEEGENYLYFSGPVSQWQTFTVSLDLNISKNNKPGEYPLNLTFDYILNSGGDGLRIIENKSIMIRVSKLDGIEYIMYNWVGGSSGPGSAGSTLLLILRNSKFSNMQGLYATISLPKGFISTENGRNIFNITPYSISSISQLTNILYSGGISALNTMASSSSVQVSRGDFIVIPISLIISPNVSVGYYYANVTLNFLDNLMMIRHIRLICGFSLLGAINYIEVLENASRIYVGKRESNISLILKNPGTGTMYDVYVSINSVSQSITFSSAVRHLNKIKAGDEVKLVWRASVSPKASFLGGVPVLVNIAFTDPAGTRHVFNQTAILFVEANAKLKLIDITVYPTVLYPNSTFSLSATLVNIGSDVARNTEVYVKGEHLITNSDSYTFLGDIDVSSQIPFTLYGQLNNYTGETTINLVVKYYNVYNEVNVLNIPINISVSEMPKVEKKGILATTFLKDNWIFIIISSVIVFMAISLILIYRMYLLSKRKMG